jgi:hypothetical protein
LGKEKEKMETTEGKGLSVRDGESRATEHRPGKANMAGEVEAVRRVGDGNTPEI